MRNQRSVLAIAIVTGEENEAEGLPVLTVYATEENKYVILEGKEEIESALNESLQHLEEPNSTVLFLAVEEIEKSQRRRRARRGGAE